MTFVKAHVLFCFERHPQICSRGSLFWQLQIECSSGGTHLENPLELQV